MKLLASVFSELLARLFLLSHHTLHSCLFLIPSPNLGNWRFWAPEEIDDFGCRRKLTILGAGTNSPLTPTKFRMIVWRFVTRVPIDGVFCFHSAFSHKWHKYPQNTVWLCGVLWPVCGIDGIFVISWFHYPRFHTNDTKTHKTPYDCVAFCVAVDGGIST